MQTASLVLLIGGIGLGLFSVLALVPTGDALRRRQYRRPISLDRLLPVGRAAFSVPGRAGLRLDLYSRGLYLVSLRSSLALFGYAVVAVAALLRTFK
jgi:hypothetical protein